MEVKSFITFVKSIEGRKVSGYAAVMGNIDSGNDRILRGAFLKTISENASRVKHLWGHDWQQPPTAKIVDLAEVPASELPADMIAKDTSVTGALLVVREYLETQRGSEVLAGIQAGAITEMSFAYDPIKFDFEEVKPPSGDENGFARMIRNLREIRLWDTSDVVWGMNELTVASKAVVPFKDTGKVDEGTAWEKPNLGALTDSSFGDLTDAERRRISNHYAWAEELPPTSFGQLKLPHHQASKTSVGPAVWSGVRSAMGVLLGAMGGVDIPSSERRGVYNHLAKHYKQWDKEPPDFKFVELAFATAGMLLPEVLKEGRVLSARNLERLRSALAVLQEILTAAEPDDGGKTLVPLTVNGNFLCTQLRLRETEILSWRSQ